MSGKFAFNSQNESSPTNNTCNKQLKHILKEHGAKKITFHGLRHTHANYLLSQKIAI
ncbi:tyrosine-type recombinase/integrase [Convivina praedatoris]|uniref:tyrosine-type recombinase/integrase n=1 Tax=Convivina praedatoris TaxID=2880963 RepID=UPI00338DCE7D